EPILLEQYVVITDYKKTQQKDLNLRAGNVVDVIQKNEHGWWFVDLDGELGWVPASYLEPRDGTSEFDDPEHVIYYVIGEYNKDDDSEVSLKEGETVEVLEQSEDGWWLVRTQNFSVGWAPSNYLDKN
ncbi:predicted protein, partial [Nematostella vectensis]